MDRLHPTEIESTKTIAHLKNLIKAKKANNFQDVDALDPTLWRVSIPVDPANKHIPVTVNKIAFKTDLDPTDDISDVFEDQPPKKNIHVIVQRPPDYISEREFLRCVPGAIIGEQQYRGP
ncbi:hypothetical protein BGZ82_001738, partial [Podila clonocystis]